MGEVFLLTFPFIEQANSYAIRLWQKNSWQKLLGSIGRALQCYLRRTFGIVVLWRIDMRADGIRFHQASVEWP